MAVADGVRLIEYNARFGDPEVMNVLPIMETDFLEVCEAILAGSLHRVKLSFEKKATVCKYVVPEGYPDHPRAGERIVVRHKQNNEIASSPRMAGLPRNDTLKMYYASVDQKNDGLYLSSSRAIAFVGIANTLEEAEKIAEAACTSVKGPVFHRPDIGTQKLIEKRVAMMRELRFSQ